MLRLLLDCVMNLALKQNYQLFQSFNLVSLKYLAINIASDLLTSFFFASLFDNAGYISIALVLLESLEALISSNAFSILRVLQKKLEIPEPHKVLYSTKSLTKIKHACNSLAGHRIYATTTATSLLMSIFSLIIVTSWALFSCLLFFFPQPLRACQTIQQSFYPPKLRLPTQPGSIPIILIV